MDGAAAAGQSAAGAPPRPSTKFTRTCSLLRQFIKEKGTLGIDIQMTAPPSTAAQLQQQRAGIFPGDPAAAKGPTNHQAAAPVLLPDLNGSCGGAAAAAPPQPSPQLTIFYGGKVFVFDNFPQDKARQFMAAASAATGVPPGAPPTAMAPGSSINHNPSAPPGPGISKAAVPATMATGHAVERPPHHQIPILASGSDLPIARRVSLNRFLEKRKDRISSKAPYQVAGSPDPMPSKPPPPHHQPSSSASPSPSLGAGDPSAGPSSSKPFPAADQTSPDHHRHGPSHVPDKTADGNQLSAAVDGGDGEEEDPSSAVPWLGLAPPPSKPPPARTGKN